MENDWNCLKPFGPNIIKGRMTDKLILGLQNIFATMKLKKTLTVKEDESSTLAGNIKREFALDQNVMDRDVSQEFIECMKSGSSELYMENINQEWNCQRDVVNNKHKEIVEKRLKEMELELTVYSAWGNISVAGDFNPPHFHTYYRGNNQGSTLGGMSGVGYLKLPDGIEREWLLEDHDPSAGMINFLDGRPALGSAHLFRTKPVVGDIYFFPAWLMHHVHPFRSDGERWSFSFNIDISNVADDNGLTVSDKNQLIEERKKYL